MNTPFFSMVGGWVGEVPTFFLVNELVLYLLQLVAAAVPLHTPSFHQKLDAKVEEEELWVGGWVGGLVG